MQCSATQRNTTGMPNFITQIKWAVLLASATQAKHKQTSFITGKIKMASNSALGWLNWEPDPPGCFMLFETQFKQIQIGARLDLNVQ